MRYPALILTGLALVGHLTAAQVINGSLTSRILGRRATYTVFLPANRGTQRYPVIYKLHCLGCDALTYAGDQQLLRLVDSLGIIIANPDDGQTSSWWLDSPKHPQSQLSTYLVREFKPLIDSLFPTLPGKKSTGLTGHSMGGFGSLHNLIEHPDVFYAAFSVKGGLDPRIPRNPDWPYDFGFSSLLGSTPEDLPNWQKVNILGNICRLKTADVRIGFYSGLHDSWFHRENERLHAILDSCGITHAWWVEQNEDHYTIPSQSMRKVMAFFDSTLSRTASARTAPASVPHKPRNTGRQKTFNIRGQRMVVPGANRGVVIVVENKTAIRREPTRCGRE